MNNKVILPSILAICIATPALAEGEIANASGLLPNKSCDESTLGVTEGTANIEAIWTANTYSISYTCANGDTGSSALTQVENARVMLCYSNENLLDSTPNNCVSPTQAVYGDNFIFASGDGCHENGYMTTGWACTDKNNVVTNYNVNESLEHWNIDSDLTCTEIRQGNTISLNWYNNGYDENTMASSTSECTYGTTSGHGALALPSTPSARPGYTFSGWRALGGNAEEEPEKVGNNGNNNVSAEASCSMFDDVWDAENSVCIDRATFCGLATTSPECLVQSQSLSSATSGHYECGWDEVNGCGPKPPQGILDLLG